jgi:hypothetical protein
MTYRARQTCLPVPLDIYPAYVCLDSPLRTTHLAVDSTKLFLLKSRYVVGLVSIRRARKARTLCSAIVDALYLNVNRLWRARGKRRSQVKGLSRRDHTRMGRHVR